MAIDLAAAVQKGNPKLSLFDPDQDNAVLDWFVGEHPSRGNAVIGVKATDPHLTIEPQGGYDLIPGELPPTSGSWMSSVRAVQFAVQTNEA
jgi:hypothetical protein